MHVSWTALVVHNRDWPKDLKNRMWNKFKNPPCSLSVFINSLLGCNSILFNTCQQLLSLYTNVKVLVFVKSVHLSILLLLLLLLLLFLIRLLISQACILIKANFVVTFKSFLSRYRAIWTLSCTWLTLKPWKCRPIPTIRIPFLDKISC